MKDVPQGQEQKQEAERKKRGSFRITQEALQILIENKATAWQIGAYLVLARHTDNSGKFTTAAHKKIFDATGASPGTEKKPATGRRLVKELQAMAQAQSNNNCCVTSLKPQKLIYTAQEWHEITGEVIPETKHALFPVSFVLNNFESDDWVWFPNEIVDGYGKFKQPLLKLKQSGDIAARLLLLAYRENNMEEFGGIPPYLNYFIEYELNDRISTSHGFYFHKASKKGGQMYEAVAAPAFGIKSYSPDKETRDDQLTQVYNALASLESRGFIYEVVTVMDAPPTTADARPLYELHNKASNVNKGEEGLVRRIDRILGKGIKEGVEYYVADKLGRYHGSYPVISRVGVLPYLVGIFRLRFRVSNPKNYTVQASWSRIEKDRREWEQELEFLENFVGIGPDSKVTQKEAAIPNPPAETLKVQKSLVIDNDDMPY